MSALLLALAAGLGGGCGDDGAGTNNTNTASPICGDGILDPDEACDEGAANSDIAADACRSSCRQHYCGDGVVDTGEGCDEGGANSDQIPGACRRDCAMPGCGDGVVDPWEACDDGGAEAGDGCDADCALEPHWSCHGAPSTCECLPYYRAPDCQECVVFVKVSSDATAPDGRSWATAFPRLQDGVDTAHAASPGCEVWVAEGTYLLYEFSPLNSLELRDGVAIYGGFAGTEAHRAERDPATHVSRLDGTGPSFVANLYHVVTATDVQDAVLDGFDITAGLAFGVDPEDRRGGGLLARGSRLAVANCWFFTNMAEQGAAIASNGSQLEITDTVFQGNHAWIQGGAIFSQDGQLSISGSRFVDNLADVSGGAIHSLWNEVTIVDSELVGNAAQARGGALALEFTLGEISRCRFVENETFGMGDPLGGGAIFATHSLLRIGSSLFLRNAALVGGDGGALKSEDSTEVLRNCTFTGNTAAGLGGAVTYLAATTVLDASAMMTNCILWGNTAGGGGDALFIAPLNVALPILRHNDVEGGLPAGSANLGGNIGAPPGFLDAVNDDYRLSATSACVDAGWGDADTPALDLDGLPRVDAGHVTSNGGDGTPDYVDLGAYEYQP